MCLKWGIYMSKEKNAKCGGFKRFIRRTVLLIIAIEAIVIAVLKILDYFKSGKAEKDNPKRDFKEVFNFFGGKKFSFSDTGVSGVIVKNICGSTELDLSEVKFKEDGFISLNACFSAVRIIVPKGVNVKVDGLIKASSVHNDVPENPGLPTLYIASKLTCSAVMVSDF